MTSSARRLTTWARVLFAAAAACLFVALVAVAAVAGWSAANAALPATRIVPEAETVYISIPEYDSGTGVRMPDVRGLSQTEALQVLSDAGIPAALVSASERPAAGSAGVVVQQAPVFGTIDPAFVEIVVSTAAAVPDVVGAEATVALSELYRLGARVLQVREYVPGILPGLVASITPAPGNAIPDTVTLVVADSAAELPLGDLRPARGSASTKNQILVDGTLYDATVAVSAGSSAPTTVAWNLAGDGSLVTGSLAMGDDGDDGVDMVVIARRDGVELGRYVATKGTKIPFEWDVRGASTFTLEVSRVGRDGEPVYLLDPTILGSYDQIQSLTS